MKSKHTVLRQLLRTLCFLLVLSGLLLALSRGYEPIKNKKYYGFFEPRSRSYLGQAPGSYDVFFVGSSLFYAGISPMDLWESRGITSFNVATSAQRVYTTERLVREVLRHQTPRVIVVDGYAVLEDMELDDAVFSDFADRFPILWDHENWKKYRLSTILHDHVQYNLDFRRGFRPMKEVEEYLPGGYMDPENAATDHRSRDVPLSNLFYLERIRLACRHSGVELMLLAMPSPYNWDSVRGETLKRYADHHRIPVLDLNELVDELGIDFTTDYRDSGDHLNLSGAKKATAYLGEYLTAHYTLEDHRSDKSYYRWDRDLKKYRDYVDKL